MMNGKLLLKFGIHTVRFVIWTSTTHKSDPFLLRINVVQPWNEVLRLMETVSRLQTYAFSV